MLKKLRTQFVCIIMLIVTLMLSMIMMVLLRFTERQLVSQTEAIMVSQHGGGPERLRPGEMTPGLVRIETFTLEESESGSLLISGGDNFDLTDGDYLKELYTLAASSEDDRGELEDYGLRYVRMRTPRGISITFAETAREQEMLMHLRQGCLLVGAAALAVFFGISLLLARWMVKPVEKAWQQQRQFVADASHELKTPLTVILTNAELLRDEDDECKRSELSGSLLIMAGQMRSLVERLLELARSDNEQHKEPMELFDFSRAVEERVMAFEPVLFEEELLLESEIEPGISLRGRQGELCQVVDVLLDNARKYSTVPGTVCLKLRRRDAHHCVLTVENPGEALSSEDCSRIFERFYRKDPARSSQGGFGLGLSIAKELVASHKGSITARGVSCGNLFTVELPL